MTSLSPLPLDHSESFQRLLTGIGPDETIDSQVRMKFDEDVNVRSIKRS